VAKFYKYYSKRKAAMMREKEEKLKYNLEEAQIFLHINLSNSIFKKKGFHMQ
jgi:hypothetical protein